MGAHAEVIHFRTGRQATSAVRKQTLPKNVPAKAGLELQPPEQQDTASV